MMLSLTLVRRAILVLTVVTAGICLLVAVAVMALGVLSGREFDDMRAGLMVAAMGGAPPLATAALLAANALVLGRQTAGWIAKVVAGLSAAVMAVCALAAYIHGVGAVFALVFLMVAILLSSPLALRSPTVLKPRKS